jgi:TatA/E family protein of Tat protein translocase
MGGMSIWHLIILLAIVLIFFGPSRLGDLGTSLGKAIRGFKKGLNEDPEIDVTSTAKREQINDGQSSQQTQQKEKEKNKS